MVELKVTLQLVNDSLEKWYPKDQVELYRSLGPNGQEASATITAKTLSRPPLSFITASLSSGEDTRYYLDSERQLAQRTEYI